MLSKTASPPVVLLFRSSLCEMSKREFSGIMRFAHGAKWNVQTIEFDNAAGNRFRETGVGDVDMAQMLKFWTPSGCIVECGGKRSKLPRKLFGKTPVVFLDSYPELMGTDAVCVSSDAEAISTAAARELLALGFSDYAFVEWPGGRLWSMDRCRAFEKIVRQHGRRIHVFQGHENVADVIAYGQELSKWLKSLPKPCGVFAANDFIAERVLSVCVSCGIAVPTDVAVLGVDDDEEICENAVVSLSSVRPDSEASGYIAASLLDHLMKHPRAAHPSVACGAPILKRRASTRAGTKGDARAIKALDYIRLHACDGLARPDVIAVMGCSSRLADLRFKETAGHSILDEIHLVRLDKAKVLLRGCSVSMPEIAERCGYASLDDFRRVFRRYCAMTVGQWLSRNKLL